MVLLQVTLGLLVTEFVARFLSTAAVNSFFPPKQEKLDTQKLTDRFLETKSFSICYWCFGKFRVNYSRLLSTWIFFFFFNVVKVLVNFSMNSVQRMYF